MPDSVWFVCVSDQLIPQTWNTEFIGPFFSLTEARERHRDTCDCNDRFVWIERFDRHE